MNVPFARIAAGCVKPIRIDRSRASTPAPVASSPVRRRAGRLGHCGGPIKQRSACPMSALKRIVLQKSFCGMGLKFSEAWARRLNNDVGDHVATRQTHRRFWQRVCGSIKRRLSLVSFFGENLAAVAFGTFATLSSALRTQVGQAPCPMLSLLINVSEM
jgi:hypothetical protein